MLYCFLRHRKIFCIIFPLFFFQSCARTLTVQVSLDEVREEWEQTSAPYHIRRIAHHYGIFKDLFDSADFLPQVMMKIDYRVDAEHMMPVFTGNVVTPTEVINLNFNCTQVIT